MIVILFVIRCDKKSKIAITVLFTFLVFIFILYLILVLPFSVNIYPAFLEKAKEN